MDIGPDRGDTMIAKVVLPGTTGVIAKFSLSPLG